MFKKIIFPILLMVMLASALVVPASADEGVRAGGSALPTTLD